MNILNPASLLRCPKIQGGGDKNYKKFIIGNIVITVEFPRRENYSMHLSHHLALVVFNNHFKYTIQAYYRTRTTLVPNNVLYHIPNI